MLLKGKAKTGHFSNKASVGQHQEEKEKEEKDLNYYILWCQRGSFYKGSTK